MILLTGSSGGIGRELIPYLCKLDDVVAVYNQGTPPANCESIQVDLRSVGSISDAFLKLKAKGKKLTIVHGAALSIDKLAVHLEEESWDSVLNVNLKANYLLTKVFLPLMIAQKMGTIIHVSSIVGVRGAKGTLAYSASKSGLQGLSEVLAKEYGRFNITSNVLRLGYFDTGLIDTFDERTKQKILSDIPVKRLGDVKSVALAIEFLINARYVTGSVIDIDGGL